MRGVFFIFSLLLSRSVLSQYTNQWVLRGPGMPGFNPAVGLDFNGGTLDTTFFSLYIDNFFNSTSICDADGKLLFTTNGQSVANTKNTLLVKGDTLRGTGMQQSGTSGQSLPGGTVILNTISPNVFLLIHMDLNRMYNPFPDIPWLMLEEQPFNAYANLIDMSYNNGQGKIDSTFAIVTDTLIEGQLAATRHANGRDWWVVTHKYASNLYYITRIGQDLSFETHTQAIGPEPSVYDPFGQACFSPDGNKYCLAVLKGGKKQNVSLQDNSVSIFDFDRCTGSFSNHREQVIPNNQVINGCQFSPNGEYLYIACGGKMFQYVMATGFMQQVLPLDTFPQADYRNMQLAPDGKIYMGSGYTYLSAIERPNEAGDSCYLRTRAYDLGYYFYTVPTFPNYYLSALDNSACDTLGLAVSPLSLGEGSWVYPNPAIEQINFSITNLQLNQCQLQISNALGQLVSQSEILNQQSEINTGTWPSGIYFWALQQEGRTVRSGKFIKE
jgi:hypothetical protein